jgi:hypothetical protein
MDVVKVMRSLTKSWNGNQGGIEPADDVSCPGGNVQKPGIFPLDSRSGEPAGGARTAFWNWNSTLPE